MAQTTAPQGYKSAYAALLDVIRFAHSITTSTSSAIALLYHAERSITYGREEDQHSQRQAAEGIWSAKSGQWIRGPSGIGKSTWKRANAELEAAELVSRIRRWNRYGKDDATEYAICWQNVRAAIDAQRYMRAVQAEPPREEEAKGVAHSGPVSGPETTTEWPTVGHSPRPASEWPTAGHTVSQSLLLTEESSHSPRARESGAPAAHPLAAAIEAATGERPTDRLTAKLLEIARKLSLPDEALAKWIHEKCEAVRARGYPLRAGLLIKAASEELIGWIKSNRELIADLQRAEQIAANATAPVRPIAEPTTTPEFASELLKDTRARKARKQGAS